jgi:hypothetical protein
MIIVKLMGGLGNQMFQYALGRRLAYQHRTSLKLDLTWFQTQTLRSYQLDTLKISAEIASPDDIERFKLAKWGGLKGGVYQAIQRRLPYYRQRVIAEQVPIFDVQVVKNVSRNAYLTGYWQSEKYFASIGSLVREELKLKVQPSADCRAWGEKIQGGQSASLHVRHGDYLDSLSAYRIHGICPLGYYNKAIHHIRKQFPETTLFVFSDDMDWARQNLGSYDPVKFVELTGKIRDQEELLLMSLCEHHIIANSSYSWWGAWLGSCPEKITIAPQNWFNDATRNTKDLIPETWIRL